MSVVVRDLRFAYGRREALHGLDLDVAGGEVVCLAGPNGAGKSTTLAVLAGLHPDVAGTVSVAGGVPGSAAARRAVGYVPAVPPLYDYLSVGEHLDLLARLWGLPAAATDRSVESLRLGDLRTVLAGQLSLGQRQRLALALVLLHEPTVLLLDEPFNGLDAATCTLVRERIAAHRADGGCVLVATHLLGALEGLASRLVVLHEGCAVADLRPAPGATLADLYDDAGRQLTFLRA